jgi:hypothetical protein
MSVNVAGNAGSGPETGLSGKGGGIWNDDYLKIDQSTIDRNHSGAGSCDYTEFGTKGGDGGGIYSTGVVTITSSTLNSNWAGSGVNCSLNGGAGGDGGAIANLDGSLVLVNHDQHDSSGSAGRGI